MRLTSINIGIVLNEILYRRTVPLFYSVVQGCAAIFPNQIDDFGPAKVLDTVKMAACCS